MKAMFIFSHNNATLATCVNRSLKNNLFTTPDSIAIFASSFSFKKVMDDFFDSNTSEWKNFDWASCLHDNPLHGSMMETANRSMESTDPPLAAPTARMVGDRNDQNKGGMQET